MLMDLYGSVSNRVTVVVIEFPWRVKGPPGQDRRNHESGAVQHTHWSERRCDDVILPKEDKKSLQHGKVVGVKVYVIVVERKHPQGKTDQPRGACFVHSLGTGRFLRFGQDELYCDSSQPVEQSL